MRLLQSTTLLFLVGCALGAPARTTAPAQQPFPTPSEGIEITAAGDDGGISLADVLRDFCRVSGQNFSMSPETRNALESTPVGLLASVQVPAAQVYSFVEGLLIRNGFVVARLQSEAPALLGLYSSQERRDRSAGEQAMRVSRDQLTPFGAHPALLIRTVVDVHPASAKEVAGALRGLAADHSLYRVLQSGSPTSVIVEGPGSWVVDVVATIDEVVANHVAYVEQFRRPESGSDE